MEIKVNRETVLSARETWEGKAELPIDTEIILPDYLPQIFKVIKGLLYLVVMQKRLEGNRLLLEGYLRCVVWYQSEEGKLCQTEQKLPFERSVELPDDDLAQAGIAVWGSAEYLNCRAVHQRRVEVRGAYSIILRVNGYQEVSVVSNLSKCGAECEKVTLPALIPVASTEKMVLSEEETELPDDLERIVDITGVGTIREQKILGGKAVFKGSTTVQITYTAGEKDALKLFEAEIPFHQIVDIEGLTEECVCDTRVEAVGCTAETSGEGNCVLAVTSLLHISAYRTAEITAVTEMFSTMVATDSRMKEVILERYGESLEKEHHITVPMPLPQTESRPLGCLVIPGEVMLENAKESFFVKCVLQLHLFWKNELGELFCMDGTDAPELAEKHPGTAEEYRLNGWIDATQVKVRGEGSECKVEVTVRSGGNLMKKSRCSLLEELSLGEPWPKEEFEALKIYYAEAGERIFEIAKRYHAPLALLKACNETEDDILNREMRLLIPGVQ